MTKIHICTASDKNYGKYAGVMIASVLFSAKKDDELIFHILDGGISDVDKTYIEELKKIKAFEIIYYKIDDKEYEICPVSYLPIATFYRVKIASILKDVDKVLYLDCDLIVNKSLKELYNSDIENYWIAGIEDPIAQKNKERLGYDEKYLYFNAGVLLINLKKWREDKIEAKLFEYMKNSREKIKWVDQDLLNDVLYEKALEVDKRWNSQNFPYGHTYKDEKEYKKALKKPYIIHYILAEKPWQIGSMVPRRKYYFKNFKKTPWYSRHKRDFYKDFFFPDLEIRVKKYWIKLKLTIDSLKNSL
jgi:lipopolysaccharide biosynthesis glycosyltransferase